MRKFLVAFALTLAAGAALAGNVPLMSGPWDPGNALGTINAWINGSLNSSTGGVAANLPAPVTTGGATIETDMQYTIAGNALATGNNFRIVANGVNDGTADARTVTFSFGGQTCALTVTGTSATWQVTFLVTETGASTQTSACWGQQGTSALAPVQATNWAVDNTAPIAVLVRQTAATAGTMTLNQATMSFER